MINNLNIFTRALAGILVCTILVFGVSCNSKDDSVSSELDNKAVGVLSADMIAGVRFNKLIIELLIVEGFEPQDSSINQLVKMLDTLISKPSGIEIVKTMVPGTNLPSYTLNDVKVIEFKNRTKITEGKTMAICVFFSDKPYVEDTENSKILGLAYANTSIVIFEHTIESLSDEILEPSRFLLESTVINHEFGHIMGLVNIAAKMQTKHQDEAHGKHCDNKDCLMYYTAETGSFVDNLLVTKRVPKFDANCLADLKAHGGK